MLNRLNAILEKTPWEPAVKILKYSKTQAYETFLYRTEDGKLGSIVNFLKR